MGAIGRTEISRMVRAAVVWRDPGYEEVLNLELQKLISVIP